MCKRCLAGHMEYRSPQESHIGCILCCHADQTAGGGPHSSHDGKKTRGGVYLVALDELEDCIPANAAFDEDTDELREAINSFLAGLPAKDRQIFIGRYFAFESIEALAKNNAITRNAIQIRLSRMRKNLKENLEKGGIFI